MTVILPFQGTEVFNKKQSLKLKDQISLTVKFLRTGKAMKERVWIYRISGTTKIIPTRETGLHELWSLPFSTCVNNIGNVLNWTHHFFYF